MPVADHTYDAAMVESVLFRSAGVKIESYAYGPATNPDPAAGFRSYKKSGKGVGHVYVHVHGAQEWGKGGLEKKSRYADRATMIGVLVEILAHADTRAALARLDDNPGTQQWLGSSPSADGPPVPVSGAWYGFAPKETAKRKILSAAINLRSHGDQLFISSSYPEDLQALATTPPATP